MAMSGGNAIRGTRVGAGPMGESERGETAPRQFISYYCASGHITTPSFAADASYNGIDANGRGIGFLPITVTPDVGIGNPFLGGGGPRNFQFSDKLTF